MSTLMRPIVRTSIVPPLVAVLRMNAYPGAFLSCSPSQYLSERADSEALHDVFVHQGVGEHQGHNTDDDSRELGSEIDAVLGAEEQQARGHCRRGRVDEQWQGVRQVVPGIDERQ